MTFAEPAHCHLLENTRSIGHVAEIHYVSTCSPMQCENTNHVDNEDQNNFNDLINNQRGEFSSNTKDLNGSKLPINNELNNNNNNNCKCIGGGSGIVNHES